MDGDMKWSSWKNGKNPKKEEKINAITSYVESIAVHLTVTKVLAIKSTRPSILAIDQLVLDHLQQQQQQQQQQKNRLTAAIIRLNPSYVRWHFRAGFDWYFM